MRGGVAGDQGSGLLSRASSAPAWCSPAATLPSPPTFSTSQPKTSSASPASIPALTQAQPDHFPPANLARWPVAPDLEHRVREPVLQRDEHDVTQPIADVRAVRRPAAQRAPDLLHSPAIQNQHTARKIAAQISRQFRAPPRQSLSHQLQQPGRQASLQTDDWSRPMCTAASSGSHMPALRCRRHPISSVSAAGEFLVPVERFVLSTPKPHIDHEASLNCNEATRDPLWLAD